jgi:hypothetical protein
MGFQYVTLRRIVLLVCFVCFYCLGFSQLPSINFGYSGNAGGCSPHTVVFNISNFASNNPATTYSLNFGDGSPIITNRRFRLLFLTLTLRFLVVRYLMEIKMHLERPLLLQMHRVLQLVL